MRDDQTAARIRTMHGRTASNGRAHGPDWSRFLSGDHRKRTQDLLESDELVTLAAEYVAALDWSEARQGVSVAAFLAWAAVRAAQAESMAAHPAGSRRRGVSGGAA